MNEILLDYSTIKIDKTMPCHAMPEKIRFISLIEKDISPVFPYINTVIDSAIYNKDGHTIMFNKEYRRISMFYNMITGAKIDDSADAFRILKETVDLINDCWNRRNEIEPNYERRKELGVLEIYKLLPGTNCRRCNQPTCLAFAAMVAQQKIYIDYCKEIFKPDYTEKRKILFEMLKSAGYNVPDNFI